MPHWKPETEVVRATTPTMCWFSSAFNNRSATLQLLWTRWGPQGEGRRGNEEERYCACDRGLGKADRNQKLVAAR